ncbi:MAG: ABC transporter ATP-binding protein [Trueperaceae bacterium]
MNTAALTCQNLSFRYKPEKEVLKDVNIEVPQGQVLGLLGPNGAGKSTLIKLMLGLLSPNTGDITLLSKNPFKFMNIRKQVGIVHQSPGFEAFLSGWANLNIYGRFFGLTVKQVKNKVEKLAKQFGEMPYLNQPIMTLSGGQRRRLAIIRALMHDPIILFIDEPSVALDVQGRQQLYAVLEKINIERNTTIIWTSHYLDEIERNCNRVIMLLNGEITLDTSTKQLSKVSGMQEIKLNVREVKVADLITHSQELEFVSTTEIKFRGQPNNFYQKILPYLQAKNIDIEKIEHQQPRLEDLYLKIIQENVEVKDGLSSIRV